jgi:sugar phosphate isomerase/epimerase
VLAGYRVLYPEEVGTWEADILQVTVYRGLRDNIGLMKNCARMCREMGFPYVVHPVGYSLLEEETLRSLRVMAQWSDRALILHDERSPEGGRLGGAHEDRFRGALKELSSMAVISFENATYTPDATWFWKNYADSITLDIGHVEAAGLDSEEFVRSLESADVEKIQYVHMHRNNGLRGGLTDHWPLAPGCRELGALEELLKRRQDITVILEINETEMTGESLKLLRELESGKS